VRLPTFKTRVLALGQLLESGKLLEVKDG